MNELILASIDCTSCGVTLREGARFCSDCGDPVRATRPLAPALAPSRNLDPRRAAIRILDHRWAVVGLLVAVGPIGLPFLWWSPRFSRPAKIITTILYFGLTVVAPLAVAWYWLDVAVRPLLKVFARPL